jgi:hypothetical protein
MATLDTTVCWLFIAIPSVARDLEVAFVIPTPDVTLCFFCHP